MSDLEPVPRHRQAAAAATRLTGPTTSDETRRWGRRRSDTEADSNARRPTQRSPVLAWPQLVGRASGAAVQGRPSVYSAGGGSRALWDNSRNRPPRVRPPRLNRLT